MKVAALPDYGYTRPNTLIRTGASVVVRVFTETGNYQRDFDFRKLHLGAELETAFAEGFARATGPGGTRRTKESTTGLWGGLVAFAKLLNAKTNPPRTLSALRPAHIAALRLQNTKHSTSIVMAVRITLRANESLPLPFRELLYAPMKAAPSAGTVASYSESEFRSIRRSARSDIRAALKRVRAVESELTAWQEDGGELADPETARRGKLLAFIAINGNVPRYGNGVASQRSDFEGSAGLVRALFPTVSEISAIVILMQCLTGQNLSIICELTTDHLRADNQESEESVLLTRGRKPRRGRYAAEMDISFTSTPVWLDGGGTHDGDDFSSPFGLYKIAEELCRRAREFSGTDKLLCAYSDKHRTTTNKGLGFRAVRPEWLPRWNGWTHEGEHRDVIDTMRLRRTFLELHQRPVAQSTATLANTYLSKDAGSATTYQVVVGEALADEVDRIHASNTIRTLSADDVRAAAQDPARLASRLGLSVEKLKALLDGRLDTIAAACTDPNTGPHNPAGQACTASFLLCLNCPNARSEPRHIPVQALLSKRIQARRLEMPADQWTQQFQLADEQLQDLLREQRADVDVMALQASHEHLRVVEALLDGRYDIR